MTERRITFAATPKPQPFNTRLLWLALPVLALTLAVGTVRADNHGETETMNPAENEDANDRIISLSFDDMDTNADNMISREEAARLPGLVEHMDEVNIEMDSGLNRTEFSKYKPSTEDLMVYEPDAVFDELDTDADNLLTEEEAARLPGLAEQMEQLDIEQDGMLNRTEFSKFEPLDRETGPGEDEFERLEEVEE